MSIATVRPDSTRIVRFAETPLAPVRVTTWRPVLSDSRVSGVSPAGLPSINTWAPAGSVVIVRRPARPSGGGTTVGAADAGFAVFRTTCRIAVSAGVSPNLAPTAIAINTRPAAISFHGTG